MTTNHTDGSRIRLAIAGVGNCASSLIQGLEYYREADPNDDVPGLMHVELGGYHIRDIDLVAAFDVDATKVGIDTAKAIFAGQNNTIRFAPVPETGVTVQRGPTLDGFGKYYRLTCEESPAEPIDVAQALRDAQADVLVSYLPVGSEQAQKYYAQACLDAGVAFVNAIPVFIASDPEWAAKFTAAGVPIVGDDIKSQVGATIVHRILARLFEDRGMVLDRTYQLNVGGNMDFKNMLERERLESKKISKTQAVTSQLDNPIDARDVHIGPALRQGRARPRHRRSGRGCVGLLHEEPAGAASRRHRTSDGRGLRRRHRVSWGGRAPQRGGWASAGDGAESDRVDS